MTKYLIIERTKYGWRIKDSINNLPIHYIGGYTLTQAEQKHRQKFNLKRKKLEKIFI